MNEKTCFLIDDDVDDQEIFILALEDSQGDNKCITANNGLEAMEKFNSDTSFVPDFIFLDMNMPFMSGKQCLQEIKKFPWLKDVKIVMYTTSSNQKDMDETKELGASHYLVKPSSLTQLSHVLNNLLQNQELPFIVDSK